MACQSAGQEGTPCGVSLNTRGLTQRLTPLAQRKLRADVVCRKASAGWYSAESKRHVTCSNGCHVYKRVIDPQRGMSVGCLALY